MLLSYLPLKYPPVLLQAVFIPGGLLLLLVTMAAPLIRRCGCKIVGTTKEWRPRMADHMVFGTSIQQNLSQAAAGSHHLIHEFDDNTSEEDLKEASLLIKLQSDLYFSGEPIYDYAFWVANHHLFLGIILHHPLSPLDTGHRFIIMVLTCFLIVFPVALVTVLWDKWIPSFVIMRGMIRMIFMAVVVIVPRNVLKSRMRKIAIEHEEVYIDMRFHSGSEPDVHKIKKDLIRQEALLYGGICVITAVFCWLTWWRLIDKHPLDLVLDNTDGLGFCFVLEMLFALVLPRKGKFDERRVFGWWGRWRSERLWMKQMILSTRHKVKSAAKNFSAFRNLFSPGAAKVTSTIAQPEESEAAQDSKSSTDASPAGSLTKSQTTSRQAGLDISALLGRCQGRSVKFASPVPAAVSQVAEMGA